MIVLCLAWLPFSFLFLILTRNKSNRANINLLTWHQSILQEKLLPTQHRQLFRHSQCFEYWVAKGAQIGNWIHPLQRFLNKNIAKDTTDPRVEFISQDHSSQILNILHFQNLDQALTSKSQPNISISTKSKVRILTKPNFGMLTKIQLCNLNKTSAAKYWPNFSFKISPEFQLQNLDQSAQSLNKS